MLRIGALLALCSLACPAGAQLVAISPDTSVVLDGRLYHDEDLAGGEPAMPIGAMSLGSLPPYAEVIGHHQLASGDQLFSLDTSATLDGVSVLPGDIVRYDGSSYAIEWDASEAGLGAEARVDAITTTASGELIVSFDTTVLLPGASFAVDDEDLIQLGPGATFVHVFDGQLQGIDQGLDLDGASMLTATGNLLLTFDGSGFVGGLVFDDEDILEYDSNGPTWTVYFDGATHHPSLSATDINAVPEVGGWMGLALGAIAMGSTRRHGSRRNRTPSRSTGIRLRS